MIRSLQEGRVFVALTFLIFGTSPAAAQFNAEPSLARVRGHVWEPQEFVFATGEVNGAGQALQESTEAPFNPWLNWRLNARFISPSGETLNVPGFYAGDASGSGVGDVWKVRFSPNQPGAWTLVPEFEYASSEINVEPLDVAGERVIPLATRTFVIEPVDPDAPGFLSQGPLRYTGESYFTFPDGTAWIKGGTDSPENFLGYAGFDGAQDTGGHPLGQTFLHAYATHVADWEPGDPDWSANGNPNAGRAIIGALNYLASEGVNSIYFLPNNLGGDCQDSFPFIEPTGGDADLQWDASRMEQWNIVLEHATRLGIFLHIVMAEQEIPNVRWLGFGLTTERMLFFKNIVAMFGHNPGIKFNFCEENDAEPSNQYSVSELNSFAAYLAIWDAYDHPLSVHTRADDLTLYQQILATPNSDWLSTTSLQMHRDYGLQIEEALDLMELAGGRSIVADQDEQGSPFEGLSGSNADRRRKEILYDVYFSGGNIEWYFGFSSNPFGGDFDVEDFRTREDMWAFMRYARNLLESTRFWRSQPDDELVQGETYSSSFGGAEVFADRGHSYLIYYPQTNDTGTFDLTHLDPGRFLDGYWFNPRTGDSASGTTQVPTGIIFDMPSAPNNPTEDWVFVMRR